MQKNAELHQAWHHANSDVRQAEERLYAAWQNFAAGRSGPPAKELIEEVAGLRRQADQRLSALLEHSLALVKLKGTDQCSSGLEN